MKSRIVLIIVITLAALGISFVWFSATKPNAGFYEVPVAEKIQLRGFSNLWKISDSVYRSEQPWKKDMKELEKFGIKTILNLRNYHTDNDEAKGTTLVLEHLTMNASEINDENILRAMQVIRSAKKPILIHCLHGSDRTGCMVASYRIIFQNWSKDDAIRELTHPVFGYHQKWFPNIVETLKSLDVDKFRKELSLSEKDLHLAAAN
jgi:protein tyrosine/serine phosphatase